MRKKTLLAIGLATLTLGLTACSSSTASSETTTAPAETTTAADTTVADTTTAEETTVEDTKVDDTTEGAVEGPSEDETTEGEVVEAEGAVAVFDSIWSLFGDDEAFFAMGGDFDNIVDGKPGNHPLENVDSLTGSFYIPADQVESVDDVATLMHGMNANTFTGVVAHVSDTAAFAEAVKTNIEGTQWICGFPDKLIVADLGDGYVAYAFGQIDIMNSYKTHLTEACADANIVAEVDLAPEFDDWGDEGMLQ